MCLCRTPPIHVYNSDLSLWQNLISGRPRSWETATTLPDGRIIRQQITSPCDCLDSYLGSALEAAPEIPGVVGSLAMLVLILAPIILALAGARKWRGFIVGLAVIWSAIVIGAMAEHYLQIADFFQRKPEYARPEQLTQILIAAPIQFALNVIFILLLPAAPFYLMQAKSLPRS